MAMCIDSSICPRRVNVRTTECRSTDVITADDSRICVAPRFGQVLATVRACIHAVNSVTLAAVAA